MTDPDHPGELIGIARFAFHEGRVEDFKRLSQRCMEIVPTQDTGTLGYDIYLNADQSQAVVIDRYRDSAALIEHHENIGDDLMAEIMTTASVEGETLGAPSARLKDMLDGSPVRLFAPFQTL